MYQAARNKVGGYKDIGLGNIHIDIWEYGMGGWEDYHYQGQAARLRQLTQTVIIIPICCLLLIAILA